MTDDTWVQKTYPRLDSDVTVTGAGSNTYGNYAELVPADTITNDFEIVGLLIEFDQVDEYFVQIGEGGAGSEVAKDEFVYNVKTAGTVGVLTLTPRRIVPANTRIAIRTATTGGGNDTIGSRLIYREA